MMIRSRWESNRDGISFNRSFTMRFEKLNKLILNNNIFTSLQDKISPAAFLTLPLSLTYFL